MSEHAHFDAPGRNRLVDSLPPPYRARFEQLLVPMPLPIKQVLYEPGEPIDANYFPLHGVVSLVTVLENEEVVEVATVGNEGFIGVPVLLGAASMQGRAIVQVAGDGLRMQVAAFRDELHRDGLLRDLLGRYTQGLLTQIAQSAACNRAHPIDQRCARWLLMTQDRVGSGSFGLTQEFLAQMLGMRRQSVNAAASILQRAGFISYRRGSITITDRAGLETASCECYQIIRDEFDRLLG